MTTQARNPLSTRGFSQSLDRASAAIRPHPHRGDVIAAGAAVLTVGIATVNARMAVRWDPAILLVLTGLGFGLVFGMGLLAPREAPAPRAYQSILLVAGLVLEAIALYRLDQVLGTDRPLSASGSVVWMAAIVTATAAHAARRVNSATCTLIAAVAGSLTALSFVQWVFDPHGLATFRWIMLAIIIGLALGATSLRDRQRRHAVALANTAGLAGLAIGAGYLIGGAFAGIAVTSSGVAAGSAHPATGWALVMLAVGFGLLAYGNADQEPGPGYLGFFLLLVFVLTAGPSGDSTASLIGWPILLLLVGGAGVVIGLRPRRPLPPSPDAGADLAPTTSIATRPAPDAPTTPIAVPSPPPSEQPTSPLPKDTSR